MSYFIHGIVINRNTFSYKSVHPGIAVKDRIRE